MPMDPQVEQLLGAMAEGGGPSLEDMTPQQRRVFYAAVGEQFGGPVRKMAVVESSSAPGPAGPIPLRIYRPEGLGDGQHAGLIYIHGGGWVMGSVDTHDKVCRRLAQTCGRVVVSVEYRLAPENPFPAAPEDVIAASRWILDNAAVLGLDPGRIGIAGDSAGGSLAAVGCLADREAAGPGLCCQVLIYPGTDNSPEGARRPSRLEQAMTPPMQASAMQRMVGGYLPNTDDSRDWRASPLLAADHGGLPPTLIITGGYDPLRDEGVAYAHSLARSGVEVLHRHYAGQIHGFIEMGGVLDAVEDAMQTIAFWVARHSGA